MSGKKPVVLVVAALLPSFGIGYKNALPWRLKKEMKYFKNVTSTTANKSLKNAVVMGRKTWESIPTKFKPLPERFNVVLTSTPDVFEAANTNENVRFSNNLPKVVSELQENPVIEKIFIIGGAEIYNKSLANDLIDELLVTEVLVDSSTEEAGKKVVEMDSFLNRDLIEDKFAKGAISDLGLQFEFDTGKISENGFVYEFCYYRKK